MMKRAHIFATVLLAAICLVVDVNVADPLPGAAFAEAQEKKRSFFERLFGGRRKEKKEAPVVKKQRQRPKKQAKKAPVRTTIPKIADANRVVVLGDQTARAIAEGLVEAYKRTPSVEISNRITDNISIVGDDFYPWLDASDFTFLGERVRAVVVALGTHDLGDMSSAAGGAAFGTPEWRRTYTRRLVDVAAQLQLMRVPIIWVLPPPLIDNIHTERASLIGNIQRAAFEPFDFRLVDVMGGFTSDEGHYRQSGASLNGARVYLRLNDGVGFTRRGADKIAYFVRREIDLILDDRQNRDAQLEGDQVARRSGGKKVVILTRPALRQDAPLAGGNGRFTAFYSDAEAREFFVNGKALAPPKNRVDNFAWPN